MRSISVGAVAAALFIGAFATMTYYDRQDVKQYRSLIGLCVSMPPLEDVRVLGLNSKGRYRSKSYFFRISQTDPDGTVSEVDEPVAHILDKPIVACRNG